MKNRGRTPILTNLVGVQGSSTQNLASRAATDESQKTRNKKQETKRFSTFAVYRLRHSETKKNIA